MVTNSTPTTENVFDSSSKFSFNLRELLVRYLKKWYWFALSIIVFMSLAYLKVRYTIPQYNVSSTIMISQDDNISESELSAFKDLGLLDDTQSKIENEIQILKSRTLLTNVVNKLKLNVRYFSEGRILEVENYPKSLIEINFLADDSIVHTKSNTFHVKIDSETSFSFLNSKKEVLETHSFGKTVSSNLGDIVITPNVEDIDANIGKIIKITVTPVKFVAENYRNRLGISASKSSSIVRISLNDPVKEKAKDIINSLVEEYNKFTIESKKQTSARTADFINERLNLISSDLSDVDDEAAGYKSKFGLASDVATQAQQFSDLDSRNVQETAQLNTQINLIESMRRFVLSQDGKYDLVPANLGFDDSNITTTVTRYNTLILQRQRLLKTSSTQNPVVVNIDQQIDGLRQVLIGSLNSLKSSIRIRLKSLRTQDQYFSGKLYSAPIRQKDLREIEREQTIKEQLYLYLLQKREEAEITSHITLSNTRVIDKASTLGSYPVSPNRRVIFAGAFFLGFIIPFMIIYTSDLLNLKINSREDLEKALTMPIIGVIPKVKVKNKIVVSQTERSGVAEAFRILRTNLDFLMAGMKKDESRVVFVTSTIAGEGKTFISSNLAKTLSISGKKVAYLGTDLRDPKFHKFFELSNGIDTKGLTNFIMNRDLEPEDIIYTDKGEDPFDIIPSGSIPPNPAELLMQERVEELFEFLKTKYDYIVVDTAPVSLVTDTLLLSKYADLCIYIVRENYTEKTILQVPENFYREKRLPNIAVLLNASDTKSGSGYGYGYGYGKKS
ncbi:GumC family protein [Aquimarina algicola]|uniref:non-specific protein-tyrosine kinase n=1 Tax=Aquimarina algicola TaxID=2589995 RepID=A0A504JJX3_9FLAO|nr:polysaccharide biosynthesis tyrosine autokinase [Aquimarina algicola]TPN89102.1 polysaccharide biosynthesis tyrosine autokinase [Aquimarina algicola]